MVPISWAAAGHAANEGGEAAANEGGSTCGSNCSQPSSLFRVAHERDGEKVHSKHRKEPLSEAAPV